MWLHQLHQPRLKQGYNTKNHQTSSIKNGTVSDFWPLLNNINFILYDNHVYWTSSMEAISKWPYCIHLRYSSRDSWTNKNLRCHVTIWNLVPSFYIVYRVYTGMSMGHTLKLFILSWKMMISHCHFSGSPLKIQLQNPENQLKYHEILWMVAKCCEILHQFGMMINPKKIISVFTTYQPIRVPWKSHSNPNWLVVSTPLKNMSSSVGMMKFPIYGKS